MGLVRCSEHKKEGDPAQYCFVQKNGQHVAPRECKCAEFRPGKSDKCLSYFPHLWENRKLTEKTASFQWLDRDEYFREMKNKFGKCNPQCPIEDAHDPIPDSYQAVTERTRRAKARMVTA